MLMITRKQIQQMLHYQLIIHILIIAQVNAISPHICIPVIRDTRSLSIDICDLRVLSFVCLHVAWSLRITVANVRYLLV